MRSKLFSILALIAVVGVFAYQSFQHGNRPAGPPPPSATSDLSIVSGSENKGLEPIIMAWARDNDVTISMTYLGSVDISLALESGAAMPYDAVWPANSLWIELGDTQRVVKHDKSIFRSPVVLGVKRSEAARLGWANSDDVEIQDILDEAEKGTFRFAMTSATQSNSGASAYIGFLYAMAGNPDILQMQQLEDPKVQDQVKRMLGKVDRGSGSSGWLKEMVVKHPDRFGAMFNYEAMIIEANQELVRTGQEPLCAIYPANGMMVADSPLGYVDKGDKDKEDLFLELQEYLLTKPVQEQLRNAGRRAALIGLGVEGGDPAVWNPNWCIDAARDIAPVPTPQQDVIRSALELYQTGLRKPSLTIWVLDVSGSMSGEGIQGLREAMFALLDPATAKRTMLQPAKRDITIVIPFNHEVLGVWTVEGNDPAKLANLLDLTQQLDSGGGTDLYRALVAAIEQLTAYADKGELQDRLPAIVAMTDGASEVDNRDVFLAYLKSAPFGRDIPIHTISFGKADEQQLGELSENTLGRMFDSKGNLPGTLRKAKGYN